MTTITIPEPIAISPDQIHPLTRPGYVYLNVADIEGQTNFYQRVLGLDLNWRKGKGSGLGVEGMDLVRLVEVPAGKRFRNVTGIYHFALLYPNRRELARAVSRLFDLQWPNSPTDHLLTKTTYLDDLEGNTIELYCESPEDGIFMVTNEGQLIARHTDGRPSNGREALDIQDLFSHLSEGDRLDQPTTRKLRMGHFHLYVADLHESLRFYHELLGFDHMGLATSFRMGMVSAGGYHHHIGFNTWQGEGAPPKPPESLGLRWISFNLPNAEELAQVEEVLHREGIPFENREGGLLFTDPSQNGILMRTIEEGK